MCVAAASYEPAVRQVNLDVVTWESCMAAVQRSELPVPYKLTHNMFCAGGAAGHDACQVSAWRLQPAGLVRGV